MVGGGLMGGGGCGAFENGGGLLAWERRSWLWVRRERATVIGKGRGRMRRAVIARGGGCEAARGVVVGLVGAGWLPPLELLALGSSFLPSLHFCTLFPEALSFGPHLFWTGHEIYKSRFFV